MEGNPICRLLNISFPFLQAGMGGVAVPDLAAAVSNAGCGGIIALYNQQAEEIKRHIFATREKTNRSFGVNLIPEIISKELLLEQVRTVLALDDPGIFFNFYGLPEEAICIEIKKSGNPILVQLGTELDSLKARSLGVDALILQGQEAGGHHLGNSSLENLLVQVKKRILDIPLVAAGGIASGKEFAYYYSLGASGCLCGTLFVATLESNAHEAYKRRIVNANASDTVITDVFDFGWPNRPHRVLRNEIVDKGKELSPVFIAQSEICGKLFPIPRFSATVPTATTTGKIEEMAMYSGISCGQISTIRPVREVIYELRGEAEMLLGNTNW